MTQPQPAPLVDLEETEDEHIDFLVGLSEGCDNPERKALLNAIAAFEAIIQELRALRAERSWIRCSERMPDRQELVLIAFDNGDTDCASHLDEYWVDGIGDRVELYHMTHWKPLPTPPEAPHAHPVETSPSNGEARGTYACPRCGLGFPHTHPDCPKCGGETSGRPNIVEPCPSCKPTPPEAGK